MTAKWTYSFGGPSAEGRGSMKDLLGGKGAGLAEMTSIGLPVPPGFTITTDVCREFTRNGMKMPKGLSEQVRKALTRVEKVTGCVFGSEEKPLLLSVRSGSRESMPGMMDTILNIGLNDRTLHGLAKDLQNDRFAFDCYRRLIQMFGNVVLGIDKGLFEEA
jgi:pyruvate,orthophosphate dikinase